MVVHVFMLNTYYLLGQGLNPACSLTYLTNYMPYLLHHARTRFMAELLFTKIHAKSLPMVQEARTFNREEE